jgi:methylmalonyl-CoA mutase N-terminal domain/subunit
MTSRLEEAARGYLQHIDDRGGMVAAIEQGYVQREIQDAAYQYQLDVEHKRRIVVGQNEFVAESSAIPILKVDPALERGQVERLAQWRQARDDGASATALQRVERAAQGSDNLMPLLIDAVKAGATVGEISNVLRSVWGEFDEVLTV